MENFNKDTILQVTNRSNGIVIYSVPDMHVSREFNRKETKKIPYGELLALAQQPGGRELIYNYLFVQNAEALENALNIKEQPEYWLKESDIPKWINTCSLNEFKDALDFAPEGIISLIKKYAVEVPLNAADKREALKEQLKFDVDKAIVNASVETEDGKTITPGQQAETTKRRSNPTYKKIVKKDE